MRHAFCPADVTSVVEKSDAMTEPPCPGGGKPWSVDKSGKPICPRCYRGLATVAGKGRSIRDLPKVPRHERPSRGEDKRAGDKRATDRAATPRRTR